MPLVFRIGNAKIYINASDHLPMHVHIRYKNGEKEAPITTDGILLSNTGWSGQDIRRFIAFITQQREYLEGVWNEYQK
ncbi:MAG: DUF4160 domain-containing protein [Deltaproteobacteria bacterium]|nr:DUF4160 domain-containing protein [Deltaproteobacteria bacterium]